MSKKLQELPKKPNTNVIIFDNQDRKQLESKGLKNNKSVRKRKPSEWPGTDRSKGRERQVHQEELQRGNKSTLAGRKSVNGKNTDV